MATIIQSLPRDGFSTDGFATVRSVRRNTFAAWKDLFFGPGPLWWRLVSWGQRNEIANER